MKNKISFLLFVVLFSLTCSKVYCQDAESLFMDGTKLIKNNKFE